MIIPAVLVGGCLYFLIFTIMAKNIILPDIIARDLLPVVNNINYILMIGLPVVFVIIMTCAVLLSRRIVAPLERLEEDIMKIDSGDYSVRLEIKGDHDLQPIAKVVNHLMDKLEKNSKTQ